MTQRVFSESQTFPYFPRLHETLPDGIWARETNTHEWSLLTPGDCVSREMLHFKFRRERPLTDADPQILMAGGKVASTPSPPFHLIPPLSLISLANRYQAGVDAKGDAAYNATTHEQKRDVLTNLPFVRDRINHGIYHSLKLLAKLESGDPEALKTDDDAAAIMWAGSFAVMAVDEILKTRSK